MRLWWVICNVEIMNINFDDVYRYEFYIKQIMKDLDVNEESMKHLIVSKV